MSKVIDPKRVLILGGGDGLALREVLKYETVLHVDLVDLDEAMINMARNVPEIVSLNKNAFLIISERARMRCKRISKFTFIFIRCNHY